MPPEDRSVALDSADGIDNLHKRIEENLALLPSRPSVGIVLDADANESPAQRFAALIAKLSTLGLSLPDNAGAVSLGPPRCGAFVLPDNASLGTLETLLEECAEQNYRGLHNEANIYVGRVESLATDEHESRRLTGKDLKELRTPAGRSKALISTMSAILRPGKAIQVSLQDNRWLRDEALALPRILAVRTFLAKLVDLPAPSAR